MHRLLRYAAVALVATAWLPLGTLVQAQETATQRPAEIRTGTCAALGDTIAPLAAVAVPSGDAQGQAGATPAGQSVTEVPVLMADLLASGHAVVVQESLEAPGTLVACGEIGGTLAADGTLAVGINAIEGSRIDGTAYFAPTLSEDGTVVTLLLVDSRGERRAVNGETGAVGMAGEDGTVTLEGETTSTDSVNIVENGNEGDQADGADGADGQDGTSGQDGQDGADGADGKAGKEGKAARGGDGGDGGDGADGGDGGKGGDGGDASTADAAPAPAPSTISASDGDGKNAKAPRNEEKATAERDKNGNAGSATSDGSTTGKKKEGGARAGEDGGANS